MFKKIIIAGVIVLLAIILIVYLKKDKVDVEVVDQDKISTSTDVVSNTEQKSKTTTSQTKTVTPKVNDEFLTISYGKDGFSPKEVQIKQGRAVKFVNNSSGSMRVLAEDNKNPIYAEFNQGQSVGKGGTYIFNFVYPGSFNIYNEFNKNHRVSVVVY